VVEVEVVVVVVVVVEEVVIRILNPILRLLLRRAILDLKFHIRLLFFKL
jgi:hypothetical protein